MAITLTSATLPVFQNLLRNLAHCMDKAEANAAARKFSPDVLVGARLAPDMLPFAAQIRIACDAAKLGVARVSGLEAPKFDDNETTFAELKGRIVKTLAWLDTVPADALDGCIQTEPSLHAQAQKVQGIGKGMRQRQLASLNKLFQERVRKVIAQGCSHGDQRQALHSPWSPLIDLEQCPGQHRQHHRQQGFAAQKDGQCRWRTPARLHQADAQC